MLQLSSVKYFKYLWSGVIIVYVVNVNNRIIIHQWCTFYFWLPIFLPSVCNYHDRLLRSDVFNPALRVKNAPEDEEDGGFIDLDNFNKDILSPAEYRRKHVWVPSLFTL